MTSLRWILAPGLVLGLVGATGTLMASEQSEVNNRLQAATQIFKDMAAPPSQAIPANVLDRAQCVVIIPNLKKGGFIVGAEHGAGFMSCRTANGWTAPAGVSMSGGSVGALAGYTSKDIVMLAMNQKAKNDLLSGGTKIGTSLTAAAGPTGRAPANTTADLLTYTHSNGAFAGVSLNGSNLNQDMSANQTLYGKSVSNIQIASGKVQPPPAAQPLMSALRQYASRRSVSTDNQNR